MVIVYYRDKGGKITSHHAAPEGKTKPELLLAVQEYNCSNEKTNGRTAYIEEVEDDGLTAHLFRKAAERKKLDKEALQDAISSIEDALDTVRGLEW